MAVELQVARGTLERAIKDCLQLNLTHFHTQTKTFPKGITVRLCELIHVGGVEMPQVTVTVE